jgi:hypothetical protein
LESAPKQHIGANNTVNPAERHDAMNGTHVYNGGDNEENVKSHALGNDDVGRQHEPRKRKGRSSYGFHRGREGVRNGDTIVIRRNGCSRTRFKEGERRRGTDCDDKAISSDYVNSDGQISPSTSLRALQELHDTYTTQVQNYSMSHSWKMTAPPKEIQARKISVATSPSSGSQITGRNLTHTTDLIRYGDTGSSRSTDTKDGLENLRHEGRSFNTDETSRNGRQAMQGSYDTHEGEVSQPMQPYAAAEPRQRDAVSSYYDFLINEGSYKFWAVFQVVTACLLIYSAFAAIYYAKYTFSMMDYPDYLDEGFFFKRSGEAYVTTTTAKPSSYSFLGLSPQTFQRIMNALSSKKYS